MKKGCVPARKRVLSCVRVSEISISCRRALLKGLACVVSIPGLYAAAYASLPKLTEAKQIVPLAPGLTLRFGCRMVCTPVRPVQAR